VPVLPTSLARWFLIIDDDEKPFATPPAEFLLKGIFSLSGLCDVLVFFLVRRTRGLLLFGPEEAATNIQLNGPPAQVPEAGGSAEGHQEP
jgi:hypothetical protein